MSLRRRSMKQPLWIFEQIRSMWVDQSRVSDKVRPRKLTVGALAIDLLSRRISGLIEGGFWLVWKSMRTVLVLFSARRLDWQNEDIWDTWWLVNWTRVVREFLEEESRWLVSSANWVMVPQVR